MPLARNPNMPRRGQGVQAPLSPPVSTPVVESNESEPVMVCIDKVVDTDLLELSNELAISENIENMPLVPFGASILTPYQMALLTGKKWQNGRTLRCAFLGGNNVVHQKVIQWAKEWEKYANLKLEFITDPNKAEIRIAFDTNDGSWSYIGTDCLIVAKDKPTMNFGWLTPNTADNEYSRVVLHEFGHALGCIHEHQHPQVGIPWDKEAVYNYYMKAPNNWTKADVDRNIFQKYSTNITQFSDWDASSIMSYSVPKSLTGGKFEIGWNRNLSDTDKKFMSRMYPFNRPEDQVAFIKKMFTIVLSREANSAELDKYKTELNNNSRTYVAELIERSVEGVDRWTKNAYSKILERQPTDKELKDTADQFKRKMTEELVWTQILSGEEFFKKANSDNLKFINRLYTSLLNREPTAEELSHMKLNLSLYGKTQVVKNFLASYEFRSAMVKAYYKLLLDRDARTNEVNSLVNSSADLAKIRFSIEASPEFK